VKFQAVTVTRNLELSW